MLIMFARPAAFRQNSSYLAVFPLLGRLGELALADVPSADATVGVDIEHRRVREKWVELKAVIFAILRLGTPVGRRTGTARGSSF